MHFGLKVQYNPLAEGPVVLNIDNRLMEWLKAKFGCFGGEGICLFYPFLYEY
jgi:hypothetical protein